MQSDINWEIGLPSFSDCSAQEAVDIINKLLISNFQGLIENWLNDQVKINNLKSFKP